MSGPQWSQDALNKSLDKEAQERAGWHLQLGQRTPGPTATIPELNSKSPSRAR